MLLKYSSAFACPECKGSLTLNGKTTHDKRIKEGEFHCPTCDYTFPIKNGIPIFLLELSKFKKHTAKSFGYKWRKFKTIDEYYKKNFLDELNPLDNKTFFKDKSVLDAGTGIGIPCYCMAENGAKEVFAIEISDSIEIAYENNKRFNNVTVAQSDIYKMPFKRNSFDVVVCVAVLQHLPNPQRAFDELLTFVKPGGTLVLWVYAQEGNSFVRFFVEPIRKMITRRLPLTIVLTMSFFLGAIFQLIAQYIYKPLNNLKVKRLPLNDYFLYRTNFDYEMNTQMIFDQLLAPLSYLFTKQEIEAFFNKPNVTNFILRHHNKNSWTAICDIKLEPTSSQTITKV